MSGLVKIQGSAGDDSKQLDRGKVVEEVAENTRRACLVWEARPYKMFF